MKVYQIYMRGLPLPNDPEPIWSPLGPERKRKPDMQMVIRAWRTYRVEFKLVRYEKTLLSEQEFNRENHSELFA